MVKYNNWNETLKKRHSFIYHKLLKSWNISVTEYAYLDIVRRYPSTDLSREKLSIFLGVSEKTVTNIFKRMVNEDLVALNPQGKKIVTDKFMLDFEDEAKRIPYTKLEFIEAKNLKVTPEEFCILDSICYYFGKKKKYTKERLAEVINQKERNIYNVLNNLEQLGHIKRRNEQIYPDPRIAALFLKFKQTS